MKRIERISICGLGKLGACMAATFASEGIEVVGLDIDPEKVRKINEGLAPVEEPMLGELIQKAGARLRATLNAADIVDTDVTFFITPSPSLPDGSFSNEWLIKAMQPVAKALRDAGKKNHLFVCSSTTTPGDCDSVLIPFLEKEIGGKCNSKFGFCYNPEFIALGNVVKGLLEPDIVLIGESHAAYGDALEELYARFNRNKPHIARMSVVSAELTKISVNSFVTMKISFTNQLKMIADRFRGADIHAILGALGNDSRIGKKYLRAGLGFGGPCFPRDNRLLAYVAHSKGVSAPLAEATDEVNFQANEDLYQKVLHIAGEREGAIVVLGLSYKPDTYITEEAPGMILARRLHEEGRNVVVHDFGANASNTPELMTYVALNTPEDLMAMPQIAAIAVCCDWPGYVSLSVPVGVPVLKGW